MQSNEPAIFASNLESISGKPRLRIYHANDKNISELIAILNKYKDIYELTLWCNNISYYGLKLLIPNLPESIQILDLYSNLICDKCIPLLLDSKTLKVIILDNNSLTDEAATQILASDKKISIRVDNNEMSERNKLSIHQKFPMPVPTEEEVRQAMEQQTSTFYMQYVRPSDTRKIIRNAVDRLPKNSGLGRPQEALSHHPMYVP